VEEIEGLKTVANLDDLQSPTQTSLSIITPPHVSQLERYPLMGMLRAFNTSIQVTLAALERVKGLEIPAVWIQPGAADENVAKYIEENLPDKVIYGGPCILVLGETLLRSRL
jgi:predicted CoA-binding protein